MNRLVRTLVGVVVAKAAVAAGWYLYQKSTEKENDWKTEGETDKPVETKEEVVTPVVVEKTKRVRKPAAKKEVAPVVEEKPKRVRKPAAKKAE
jgi:hypothetical protein